MTERTGSERFAVIAEHLYGNKIMESPWAKEFSNYSSPVGGSRAPRGVFTSLCEAHELQQQMQSDELPAPAISVGLRRWALQQEDVEKVTIGYIGGTYSIAILFSELQLERISHLYDELENVVSKFGEISPLIYPLGPAQRNSFLLNSADCHIVYPA